MLDISSDTAQVVPGLLKALAILSDTTVKRTPVDQEDLKPYQKSEKRPHFSRYILRSSASMYESLGSPFFRTTTATQFIH